VVYQIAGAMARAASSVAGQATVHGASADSGRLFDGHEEVHADMKTVMIRYKTRKDQAAANVSTTMKMEAPGVCSDHVR